MHFIIRAYLCNLTPSTLAYMHGSTLNILYQNVRGLRTKTHVLTASVATLDSDVVCLTETWLNDTVNDAELCPIDFQVFRRDRDYVQCGSNRGGGCLVLLKNNLIATRLLNFESHALFIEDLWIRVKLPSTVLYICTVYISPTNNYRRYTEHFQKVIENIESMHEDAKIVVVGDYNLSAIQWILP